MRVKTSSSRNLPLPTLLHFLLSQPYSTLGIESSSLASMADVEKPATAMAEEKVDRSSASEHSHIEKGKPTTADAEKTAQKSSYLPQSDDDYVVTWKTWVVVWILAWSYGISFWIVPSASACGATIATDLGDVTRSAWYIST